MTKNKLIHIKQVINYNKTKMQATLEDWDVCPFDLDEIQYQRDNDLAFQDYVNTLDNNRSKDWYQYESCFSYHITDDMIEKYVEYCRRPENKKIISELQEDSYKITQKIEEVEEKIKNIAKKKHSGSNPKLMVHLNKHISILENKKEKLRKEFRDNNNKLDAYDINTFILKHYKRA